MAPRWSQDGPKMAPRWPQDGPNRPREAPRWPQDGPKMAPRWPQDGPRWPQDGPKMAQDGPKMPQDTPRWSKMAPRGPKRPRDGPRIAPCLLTSTGTSMRARSTRERSLTPLTTTNLSCRKPCGCLDRSKSLSFLKPCDRHALLLLLHSKGKHHNVKCSKAWPSDECC